MLPLVAPEASPEMTLRIALYPSETSLALEMAQVSSREKVAIERKWPHKASRGVAKLTHAPGACAAPYTRLLLLCGGWLSTTKSLAWAYHATASRTVSMASPLTTIAVVKRRSLHPSNDAAFNFRASRS